MFKYLALSGGRTDFYQLNQWQYEVWCFAVVCYLMVHAGKWGGLTGNFDGTLMDCVYFSFTTCTTIGFGDISPVGNRSI